MARTTQTTLSRGERRILDAVTGAASGISLGDLEIETGYEGAQLTRTLDAMIARSLIHPQTQPARAHYSVHTLTKYFAGPAAKKAKAA